MKKEIGLYAVKELKDRKRLRELCRAKRLRIVETVQDREVNGRKGFTVLYKVRGSVWVSEENSKDEYKVLQAIDTDINDNLWNG